MAVTSRVLKTVFALPLSAFLAVGAHGFDLTGEADDTEYTATVKTSETPADGESIIIDGTPVDASNAGLLVDSDTAVVLDGRIRIRDRSSDTASEGSAVTLTDAYGVHVTTNLSGDRLRLKDGARIEIVEIRGPDYDGSDDDTLPDANTCGDGVDRDTDDDGIIEGAPACGTADRIGLWIAADIGVSASGYSLIGESGSAITVDGNAATVGDVAGVKLDNPLTGHLDLSTAVTVHGDKARGVDINATIGGNYRQRGAIDVRGEDTVAIDVGAAITGSLMIESSVNATGYSSYLTSSVGAPRRGGGDFEDNDDDEFSAQQIAANPDERRQSEAAVKIASPINGGVIIGGAVNRAQTRDELLAFTCRAEDDGCEVIGDGISEKRSNGDDVMSLKTDPFHYDENRGAGRLTSYGESEATLLISSTIGTSGGSTVETFLDTLDDDDDDTSTSSDHVADLYDSTEQFFYSHGLMNRGSIEANGLYDSVNPPNAATGYPIDRPATALKLDNSATIHGGIFNSGTISALAYNADAVAVDLVSGTLNDGLRADSAIMLNEGTISASTFSHTKSYNGVTKSDNSATAVKIGSGVTLPTAGVFINAGSVSAVSRHTQPDMDTDDTDDYETITGDNAMAFDLRAISGNFNLTQQMRVADMLLDASATNSNANPFKGSGDLQIDRAGDTQTVGDSTVSVGDGKIDTRDVAAPSITGDVKFGGGANVFTVTAGSVNGHIDFGGGSDSLLLGNSMQDDDNDAGDEDDDYTAPITTFQGRISNSGTLNITAGGQDGDIAAEKTRLHFLGQEGDKKSTDADYVQLEDPEGLVINNLTLDESADLRFTVDPDNLTDTVLDVTSLTLSASASISPFITTLIEAGNPTEVSLVKGTTGFTSETTGSLDARVPDEGHPYIYNVNLKLESASGTDKIIATFDLKTADQLGFNINEAAAYDTVLAHFGRNDSLEAAITGITDADDFDAYYGQLLPHFGDGTMRQLSGLADSATGAVGQHLQIVRAGGRHGGDGWGQQFGDYRKQDGTRQTGRISGTSYGLATGYDAPFGLLDALGIYAQMSFTSVHEKPVLLPNATIHSTDEVKAESFGFGAYLADSIGPLSYELNAAVGSVTFDSVRGVSFNGVTDVLRGSWDGTSTAASARLTYPIWQHRHLLRLEAGLDHFALEQDGYRERTSNTSVTRGLAMQLGSTESDMTSQFIGLRGGYRSGGGSPSDIVWEPNYYIGYRSVSDTTPYKANANFLGSAETFTLQSQDEPSDSVDLGFGLAAHNDYFAFEFNYRGKLGNDEETHGGGISIRLLF